MSPLFRLYELLNMSDATSFSVWKSDTPDEVGKSFIRRAIDEAVEMVSAELELDEADQPT